MTSPNDCVILSAVRTPVGRAHKGFFKDTRADDLAAAAMREALARSGVPGAAVDDVVLGCAMPEADQGMNVARIASFAAGIPHTAAAVTVNRFCASGLQAIADAARAIRMGEASVVVAGGVESMTNVPMGGDRPSPNPRLVAEYPEAYTPMGTTAEFVAQKYEVSREDQEAFAAESQRRAGVASAAKAFDDELVSVSTRVQGADGSWREIEASADECPRPSTNAEGLAKLRPAFHPKGSVTAGTSSPLSDGAAAVVLASRAYADANGLKPLGVFRGFAVAGVAPEIMGIGPVAAVPKLLEQQGITLDDIDHIELNEAFAAQSLAVIRELGMDPAKVNPLGGAIALGHPLGCTGAKLTATALHALRRRGGGLAMITMCIGGGMGAAGLIEV